MHDLSSLLQLRPRQAFIEALRDVPPKPADMQQILTFNRGHHEVKANA
jgi:hypothetical protein